MKKCDHTISWKSTMVTIVTAVDYYLRKCNVCGQQEVLRRYTGPTDSIITRNSFRTRHEAEQQLADILQPWSGDKPNKDFAKVYPHRAADFYNDHELKQLGMDKIKSKRHEKIKA